MSSIAVIPSRYASTHLPDNARVDTRYMKGASGSAF